MSLHWNPLEESTRLAALHALGVLDTPADPALDALVRAAAALCDVPISLVSLVDSERQWFKANHGLSDVSETPRDWSFCSHAIATSEPLEIRDARADARFATNPLVTSDPGIRFYFGVPLALSDGERIGTLCVIDQKPRRLGPSQRQALAELGYAVARLLERRPAQVADELRQRALEELAASSTQAILLTDAEGRTVWTNQAFTEMSGYPLAELLGQKPGAVLQVSETDPATVMQIRAAMAARRICRVELLNARRDGRRYWTTLEIYPVLRQRDVLTGFISFQQDVSARKQVEQELAESQLLLEQAANAAGFGAGYLDLASGQILWDPLCAHLLGVGPDFQPTLERCLALFPTNSAEHLRRALAQVTASTARELLSIELCRTLPDGRERWIRVSGRIEFCDEQPVRMIGGLLDVTAAKRTEQALADSQAFLEHAGQIFGVGAYRVDLDTGRAEWSPQTCRMHEVPENFQPTLDQAIAFYPPESRSTVERLVGEAITQEGRFEFELPLVTARGRRIWVQATGEVFREVDGRRVMVGGILDITERYSQRKALEESHRRIALANAAGGIGTWEWRITEGVLHWDEGTFSLMGTKTNGEPASYARWMALIHDADRDAVAHNLRAALQGDALDWLVEYRTNNQSAPSRYLMTVGRIQRDACGQALSMTGVTWDVSEQRQLTERLQQQTHDLRWQLALGDAITRAQRVYIHEVEPHRAYDALLEDLLALTGSLYGFVGEVRHEADLPVLRIRAITDLSWDAASQQMQTRIHAEGLDFRRLDTLITAPLISGEPLISHDPASDPRRGGLPTGHPPLQNFLGIPVLDAAGVVAMVGLANRSDGFDLRLVERLQPLLATIGQLVRAEIAMRASREGKQRLAATIEAARVGTWEWNVRSGELLINERWAGMLGYTIAELAPVCADTWYLLGHPQDIERADALLLANFRGEIDYCDVEVRLRHREGHWVWVHSRGRVASRDSAGQPLKMYGTHTDISERKRAQAALQQNEARLRALFELSPVGITLQDVETREVLDANPALLQMVGFTLEEHLQQARGMLTPPEYEEGSLYQLKRVQETGSYGPFEKEIYHRDGSRLPVRLQGRSFRDGDGRTLVWSMVEDLTHSRRVDRMKREFVSVVSHELRTPLTALRGAIGLMKRLPASTTGPGAELLQIAEQNALRLGFLVDDLLDMERLSAGKLRLELTAVSVGELLTEATSSHRTYLSGRRDGIRVIEPVPAVSVLADRQRLIQVLSNLLSNSLKFSPPGGVVELGVERLGPRLRFWVQDQGPGIPEDFRERIFERFAQADASDTRQIGGSGLGLAIVRELAQLMDGGVGFVSEPGCGARFWIELPLADAGPDVPKEATR